MKAIFYGYPYIFVIIRQPTSTSKQFPHKDKKTKGYTVYLLASYTYRYLSRSTYLPDRQHTVFARINIYSRKGFARNATHAAAFVLISNILPKKKKSKKKKKQTTNKHDVSLYDNRILLSDITITIVVVVVVVSIRRRGFYDYQQHEDDDEPHNNYCYRSIIIS